MKEVEEYSTLLIGGSCGPCIREMTTFVLAFIGWKYIVFIKVLGTGQIIVEE